MLHCAVNSDNLECVIAILSLYPESERLPALNMPNEYGYMVLHHASSTTHKSIMEWLSESSVK